MPETPKFPEISDFGHSIEEIHGRLFPGNAPRLFPRVIQDVEAMFAGRYLDYQASDTPYHDLRHTREVTLCLARILEGLVHARSGLTARQFELGVAAALLHDTGYLKLRSDHSGTGAKYTFTHVLRGCAVASAYLPPLGVTLPELDGLIGAIRCTGSKVEVDQMHFGSLLERTVGLAVATADYLGQMWVADYVDMLPKLFAEFEESDDYSGVPRLQRQYRSAKELIEQTPSFWKTRVFPKLEKDFNAVYRYLERPYPGGANAYLEAIEANMARIEASA